jgi:hypothetical protein
VTRSIGLSAQRHRAYMKSIAGRCRWRSRCGSGLQSSLSLPFGDAGRRELSLLIESHAPAPLRAANTTHKTGGVAHNGLQDGGSIGWGGITEPIQRQ